MCSNGGSCRVCLSTSVLRVQPGTRYAAKVVKMMDYGAFVELTGGTQGLLHISEIAVEKVRCGSQAFSLLA